MPPCGLLYILPPPPSTFFPSFPSVQNLHFSHRQTRGPVVTVIHNVCFSVSHSSKASPTSFRILSSHWSLHDSGSNASPTLKNPGLSLAPPWIWPLIGQECLNGSSLHEVVNSQKVKSRLGCVSGRGPYLWKYPSQTPSVIYFWNPWVQTSTLLHSEHHLPFFSSKFVWWSAYFMTSLIWPL